MQTNVYSALLALQQDLPQMAKDAQGYNYKYFDINQLVEKVKPLLAKHQLTILQPLDNIDGAPAIRTILADASGNTLEWVTPLPAAEDPQKLGSAITYMRRYALQSLLFMQAEDDDAAVTVTNNEVDPF